jgi:hypothetical protein
MLNKHGTTVRKVRPDQLLPDEAEHQAGLKKRHASKENDGDIDGINSKKSSPIRCAEMSFPAGSNILRSL